jgi:3',5'-cyclic AMP phosphodiesterase CpdA
MPLILHLSDLHLGPVEKGQVVGDYKNEIVPLADRTNRHDLLRTTLREIGRYLRGESQTLDAIVITGDTTLANDERGFELLPKLLDVLEGVAPPSNRILIVPGNHDVRWQTPPGSAERYDQFVRHTRTLGYITPLLDGVDGIGKGPVAEPPKHYLLGEDASWVVIPINSANYSGTLEPLKYIDESDWDRLTVDPSAKRELERLRLQDVPRVSEAQLAAARELLIHAEQRARDLDRDPKYLTRIVAIHHQLLPISTVEEFKPYESIVNLGLLRHFLRENRIDIVLHGHKHADFIYRDHIYDTHAPSGGQPHEVLVIAGATIGTGDYRRTETCRLIDLQVKGGSAKLSVASVPAIPSGGRLASPSWRRFTVSSYPHGTLRSAELAQIISGDSASDVYDRALALFEDLPKHSPIANLMCTVFLGSGAGDLPSAYPEIPGVAGHAERQRWFVDLVAWWQRPKSVLAGRLRFTHGGRIFRLGGKLDQLDEAVKALRAKEDSSRAIVILVDPIEDEIGNSKRKFPAFCLFQLTIRRLASGGRQLDCIAYFRKQEIRYWWPVNLAELAAVQRKALDRLIGDYRDLGAGDLTTIAASAYAGASIPKVAVPAVDRLVDENPQLLASMVYALFWRDMPDRMRFGAEWTRLLDDLMPEEYPDPDGVPVALDGLEFLLKAIRSFSPHRAEATALVEKLEALHELNSVYADETVLDCPPERHTRWRDQVTPIVGDLRQQITQLLK